MRLKDFRIASGFRTVVMAVSLRQNATGMRKMSDFGNSELRVEVEAAIVAEMKRVGPKAFDRKTIIRQFATSGVHRATLYRWIDKAIESGVPGQALARQVKSATAARIKRHKKPEAAAKAAATDVVASLPAAVTLDDIAGQGGVPAIEQLNYITTTARKIIAQAQGMIRRRCASRSCRWPPATF